MSEKEAQGTIPEESKPNYTTVRLYEIPIHSLRPHPTQEEVYGTAEPGEALVESVRKHGIQQPPIVTPLQVDADGEAFYYLVGGFRRWRAALACQHESVLCEVKEFDDLEIGEMIIELNASNRERTPEIKAREFNTLAAIVKEKAARRRSQGVAMSKYDEELEEHFGSRSADEIARRMNISPNEAQYIDEICGQQHRSEWLHKLRHRLWSDVNALQQARRGGDTSAVHIAGMPQQGAEPGDYEAAIEELQADCSREWERAEEKWCRGEGSTYATVREIREIKRRYLHAWSPEAQKQAKAKHEQLKRHLASCSGWDCGTRKMGGQEVVALHNPFTQQTYCIEWPQLIDYFTAQAANA